MSFNRTSAPSLGMAMGKHHGHRSFWGTVSFDLRQMVINNSGRHGDNGGGSPEESLMVRWSLYIYKIRSKVMSKHRGAGDRFGDVYL